MAIKQTAHDPQTGWRTRLANTWERTRWLVLAGFWLAALILGYVGFALQAGATRSPASLFYLTLQLISLNSGAVAEPVPWPLNIARFLIPLLTAVTAFQAFALLFQEQFNLLRLQRTRGHVVICGLSHKGFSLVKGFRQQGERVVVIERDESGDLIEPCRAQGAILILGDAADPQTLRKAAVGRAKTLIAVCNDDINAEIAVQARQIVQETPGSALTCILHIVDPQLYELLRDQELDADGGGRFRLELFNVYTRAAQILVKELPQIGNPAADQGAPCLVVAGLGLLGQSLVVQAARTWWDSQREARRTRTIPLRIFAVDLAANLKVEALRARYPRLGQACELVPIEMDVRSPAFRRGEFLPAGSEIGQVDIFYVCIDDDNLSLYTSLALQRLAGASRAPVVVRVSERTGLANLINRARQPEAVSAEYRRAGDHGAALEHGSLRAFILFEQTCSPDLLLGGTHEVLARAIHEEYLNAQLAAGETLYSRASLAPWEELTEEVREANRRQVDRIGQKLSALGCRLAALTDWDAAGFKFAGDEVERMAQMEYAAWLEQPGREDRRSASGEVDPRAKTRPNPAAWSELEEAEKEKNRRTVRELARFLARAGYQIER